MKRAIVSSHGIFQRRKTCHTYHDSELVPEAQFGGEEISYQRLQVPECRTSCDRDICIIITEARARRTTEYPEALLCHSG